MQINLSGRTVVITGGSSGIGLACAKLFLEAGANTAICGRDKNKLANAAEELGNSFPGNRVFSECCDVLDREQVGSFATAVQDRFASTDILINNAGEARQSTFPIQATTTGAMNWSLSFSVSSTLVRLSYLNWKSRTQHPSFVQAHY